MQAVDDGICARDPLGSGDEQAESHDEHHGSPVVEPADLTLWMWLAELLLLEDRDVLSDGGENADNAGHRAELHLLQGRGSLNTRVFSPLQAVLSSACRQTRCQNLMDP